MDEKSRGRTVIGAVAERRTSDRGNNAFGLLHLARLIFAESHDDAGMIDIDWDDTISA